MRIVLLITIFITELFFSHFVLATSVSCTPIDAKIQNKIIVLPGLNASNISQIYFLHNISKKSLWIDHPLEGKPSAKAGWSSFFQPGKWSAILINRKDFAINCAVIEPGKVNFQDCSKTISVCLLKNVRYESKRKGSYWLAEDKSYEELLAALQKRGIEIPKSIEEPKKIKEEAQKQKVDKKSKAGIKKSKNEIKD